MISTTKFIALVVASLLLGFSSIFYSTIDEQTPIQEQTQQEASADIAPSDSIDVAYVGD